MRCFALISSDFISPLPHPSQVPLKIPTVLSELESNMHLHVYMHICLCIHMYTYMEGGMGECVYGLFSRSVKEFTKPYISSHATVWHPAGELVLLKIDHLLFLLVFHF